MDRLPIEGFKGTPEEIERQWFEQVYNGRGDSMLQLTWRAVIMGSVLGGVLSLTNLYIGLKAGWGFGVAITACILSYAIWTFLYKVRLARTPMTILENNCMQSTASSAGYSTGGTLVSAFAAYILLNERTMPVPLMMGWVFFLAILGVTMAIPMKRQMINIEQLRFPSGIAAAETLRALHSTGSEGDAVGPRPRMGRALRPGQQVLDGGARPDQREARAVHDRDLGGTLQPEGPRAGLDGPHRDVLLGADVHRRRRHHRPARLRRACCSAASSAGWSSPLAAGTRRASSAAGGYRAIVSWTLWAGTACMVTSGLLSFAHAVEERRARLQQHRHDVHAAGGPKTKRPMEAIESPSSWFFVGQVVGFAGLAVLGHITFHMPYWQTLIAVVLSFALALVACRVTGETDTTPVGAMGKITQLTFGAISPGNMNVNLMSANVTAACAGASADLLTDLKSGYLLGAHPRKQFIAQFAGIFVGTLIPVICLQHPRAEQLGAGRRPVPGPGGADLEGGRRGAEPRPLRPRAGQGLVHRDRRARRDHPAAALEDVPEGERSGSRRRPASGWRGPSTGTTACSSSSARVDRLAAREEVPEVVRGLHLPGRLRRHRRREPDGRGPRHLAERPRDDS